VLMLFVQCIFIHTMKLRCTLQRKCKKRNSFSHW